MPQELPRTIGRYEVVDRVGRGGMGVVFRARDPRIGRQVAIKLLSVPDESLRDRFLQEAQSVGSLAHRNIVTIFDYGEHDGQSYIVMEFVEGVTLAEQIHDNVPIPLWRKLEIMEEVSAGLDYAHNKGIVHRDIKPANVMTDREGIVKILDFGIARVGNISMTQAGMMLGTPNYMSPEQFESGRVDRRSDIFSVGVLFYELLTYRKAFTGEQIWDVMKAVVGQTPTPLAELVPGLDLAVTAAVNRAIEKDPAKRYQTLSEMSADLANVRARLAVKLSSPLSVTVLTPPPDAPPRTPRPGTDRALISKRRAERIEEYLKQARRAFDAGEFGTAVEACDQALLLDPDDAGVHSLLERARQALDRQQALEWMADARSSLERGDLDKAAALIDQATQIDPASLEARDVKAAIDDRLRQRDAEHKKRQTVQDALGRARASLTSGHFESALRSASDVLMHDPANDVAHQITRQAMAEIQQRREHQLDLDAAQAAVDEQKREFAAGRWHQAIGALERYTPRHEIVAAALADMRTELAELDRRAREEEEQQQREQAEAQQRWVARQLDLAKRAIAGQQFADAIEVLEHVQRNSPDPPGLAALLRQAQLGKATAEDLARRQQEIVGILERAAAELGRGKLLEARSLVASALAVDPAHPEALAKLREIKTAIESDERRRALDRDAERAVADARRRFETGEHASAIKLLETFAPAHAATTRALEELKRALADFERQRQDAARQREAERARREQEEASAAQARAAREREATRLVADAHTKIAANDLRAAAERIKAALAIDPAHAGAADATVLLNTALARQKAEQTHVKTAAAANQPEAPRAASPRVRQESVVARAIERPKPAVGSDTSAEVPKVPTHASGGAGWSVPTTSTQPAPITQRITDVVQQLIVTIRPHLTTRNLSAAGAALVVLLVVVSIPLLRSRQQAPADAQPAQSAAAPAAAAPAAATAPSPVAAAPPPSVDQQLAEIRGTTRQQFSRGDWQNGLTTAAAGFDLRKDDPELRTIVNDALGSARSRITAERDATTALGRSAVGTSAFKLAVRKQQSVDQLQRNGQTPGAFRAASEAVDLFKQAQTEGQRLAQAEASAGKPGSANALTTPAPPTQPGPTTQAPPSPPATAAPQQVPSAPPPPPAAPAPAEPAPAVRPVPPPSPTPSTSVFDERLAIRTILQTYADAYSRLDVAAVKRVYPGINERALRSSFSATKSQQVHILDEQFLSLSDTAATVTCTWDLTFVGAVGGVQRQAPKVTLRLQKSNGAWTIVDRR